MAVHRGPPARTPANHPVPREARWSELEFTESSFSIPVVHRRVVQFLKSLGIQDVQFLPVEVEGHTGPWFILNALRVIRCIDEARCRDVRHFKPEDGQPEKVGEYKVVSGLRIDPSTVGNARVFRPWGWTMVLIVSEDLKQALEPRASPARFSPRYEASPAPHQHRAAKAASSQ